MAEPSHSPLCNVLNIQAQRFRLLPVLDLQSLIMSLGRLLIN